MLGRVEYVADAQEHVTVQVGCPDRFQVIGVRSRGERGHIIEYVLENYGNAEFGVQQVHAGKRIARYGYLHHGRDHRSKFDLFHFVFGASFRPTFLTWKYEQP